ncbi:tigger transposable element-derived protein 1-like [Macrobrachium rosenbergii]|uniref:tigger transposable element-derived protein 1-like n=1 Tax=Macrobrachium rosenbergii TaxID=79674 RepID=UPI0034D54C5C
MAPKRQSTLSDASASKKRKNITVEVKYDIIKCSERGESNTEIGCALGLSRTMVVTIVKDKQRILKHVQDAASMKATEKARELHAAVVKKNGEGSASEEFSASRDWFNSFKTRANLHNMKLQGEAASADSLAAESFPSGLAEIIREGGYTADQVFNVDETGLCWKRMPNRTFLSKEEKSAPGHKVGKERLTLLFGANASGDLKLKPLLVYLAENPRAFKGIFKSQLPVIWKSNKTAWVTLTVFRGLV